MEEITFSALAPRRGTRPMLAPWSDIGTSALSGGAFNWGSLWSGLKNFGSNIKHYGSKVWNSSSGQALRQKLKDTNLQEKIINGISTGIHGAIDLAQQELDRKLAEKLKQPLLPEVEPPAPIEETLQPSVVEEVISIPKKRPRDEQEEIVIRTEQPPSYNEIFPNSSAAPLVPTVYPTTRPHPSMVTPVLPAETVTSNIPVTLEEPPTFQSVKPTIFTRPSRSNWQSTLNSIVGLGVKSAKRKRCY